MTDCSERVEFGRANVVAVGKRSSSFVPLVGCVATIAVHFEQQIRWFPDDEMSSPQRSLSEMKRNCCEHSDVVLVLLL